MRVIFHSKTQSKSNRNKSETRLGDLKGRGFSRAENGRKIDGASASEGNRYSAGETLRPPLRVITNDLRRSAAAWSIFFQNPIK